MSSNTKSIRFLISYEFFLSLLTTFVLMVAVMLFLYKFKFWDVLNLMPSKVFIGLIFLNRVFGFLYEIFIRKGDTKDDGSVTLNSFQGLPEMPKPLNQVQGQHDNFRVSLKIFSGEIKKKMGHALISVGILIIISGLALNYLYRFEGVVSLGEGEGFIDYDSVEKGPLSKPLKSLFTVEDIEGDPLKFDKSSKVKVHEGKKLIVLSPKRYTAQSLVLSSQFSVLRVEPAPRFLITDKEGKELHSAFVKLNLNPQGKEDYFRSPAVAHRFYLSLTGKTDKPFNVKIVRGKLIIKNTEIAVGEEVDFEGLKISFPEISKWAEIKVKHYPGNKVVLIGFVMAVAGIIGIVFKRLKVNPDYS